MGLDYKDAGAAISACGDYRYSLWRWWGKGNGQKCTFIMLNPSTADGLEDDPTIRRCVAFAKRWGYSGLTVVNLFAVRATDPRDLYDRVRYAGMLNTYENNKAIVAAATLGDSIVCAWGTCGVLQNRGQEVIRMLTGFKLECLGVTKGGLPKHPLYLSKDTERQRMPELARIA